MMTNKSSSKTLQSSTGAVVLLWLLSLLFACQQPKQEASGVTQETNDTTQLMHRFLAGLWSVDSQNFLNNEGFYIQPDGSLSLVASEAQGQWKLLGKDTLYLSIQHWAPEPLEYYFVIDSLDPEFMILRDSSGQTVYRKVPFGVNADGTVLNGFMGSLSKLINAKEYQFDLPSAKRIKLEVKSASPAVVFQVYEGDHELTAAAVKSWSGILVRSGKYKAVVSLTEPHKLPGDEPVEFDLKVYGY